MTAMSSTDTASLAERSPARALALEINGDRVIGQPEPRTSLADFLREELDLTGTHLGCEHGVCGACTVEVDGVPVRSCITFAHACHGKRVRTIEGYDDDAVMAALREAFSEFHGLQCGFCTPGMLIACRDMILRYETLDEAAIRVALGGNLCRCTGYVGIVQAVQSVFARRNDLLQGVAGEAPPPGPPQPITQPLAHFRRTSGHMDNQPTAQVSTDDDQSLHESVSIKRSAEEVWAFMRDVERVVPCIPGAKLLSTDGDRLELEMEVSLGAIRARFRGEGQFSFDDAQRQGRFEGSGRDTRSGSAATGAMAFSVVPGPGANACRVELIASYGMTGALSQFSRGGLVKSFVGALARMFGDNVQKVLAGGEASTAAPAKLSVFKLLSNVITGWFRGLFRR